MQKTVSAFKICEVSGDFLFKKEDLNLFGAATLSDEYETSNRLAVETEIPNCSRNKLKTLEESLQNRRLTLHFYFKDANESNFSIDNVRLVNIRCDSQTNEETTFVFAYNEKTGRDFAIDNYLITHKD